MWCNLCAIATPEQTLEIFPLLHRFFFQKAGHILQCARIMDAFVGSSSLTKDSLTMTTGECGTVLAARGVWIKSDHRRRVAPTASDGELIEFTMFIPEFIPLGYGAASALTACKPVVATDPLSRPFDEIPTARLTTLRSASGVRRGKSTIFAGFITTGIKGLAKPGSSWPHMFTCLKKTRWKVKSKHGLVFS
jgi:hypothetical protein